MPSDDSNAGDSLKRLESFLRNDWEQLRQYADQQMGALLRATASPDDVLQEACVRAFQSIHTFLPGDDPIESLGKWFRAVLRRSAIDMARKNLGTDRKNPTAVLRLESDLLLVRRSTDPTPSRETADRLAHRELINAVRLLPTPTRDVVVLYYWEGLTLAEIAQQLDLPSPNAVGARLNRARLKLREILGSSSAYYLPPR